MRSASLALFAAVAAGLATPAPAPARLPLQAPARAPVRIALTFDDLPAHGALPPGETRLGVARAILAALKAHRVREAYGFVAGSFGADDPDAALVLRAWRAAGHPLANHSWSHVSLDATDPERYTADIARNEAVIAPLMAGRDWHWFRYPFLAEGTDPNAQGQVRAYLASHHYRVASVTLNFDDWAYNDAFARCAAAGDTAAIASLEKNWLGAAQAALDRTRAATGRGTPHVALLHIGAFTARMLPALLSTWERAGARFAPLGEVEAHPLYHGDTKDVARGRPIRLPAAASGAPDLSGLCRTAGP